MFLHSSILSKATHRVKKKVRFTRINSGFHAREVETRSSSVYMVEKVSKIISGW
jgi:hypothetical protein